MDAQSQPDSKAYADRLETLCRAQADEIARLRAELARATEGAGALAVLQALYRDDRLPEALRAKCAIGCLPHEEPRLLPERQLELKAEPEPIPLAELVRLQRARADLMMSQPPFSDLPKAIPLQPNANGRGDDDSDDH
jgi:hypothetical protein